MEGKDPKTGKFLPGNKLGTTGRRRDENLKLAMSSLTTAFPPDEWGNRCEEIWRTAAKMGSAKTQLAVLQFVADRVIGKPVVTHEIEKNETKRILTLLVDNPVTFSVEREEKMIDVTPNETDVGEVETDM